MDFELTEKDKKVRKTWFYILIISSIYNLITGLFDITKAYIKNAETIPSPKAYMVFGYSFLIVWVILAFIFFYQFSYKKMGIKFLIFYLIAKPLSLIAALYMFFTATGVVSIPRYLVIFFSYVIFAFFYAYSIKQGYAWKS